MTASRCRSRKKSLALQPEHADLLFEHIWPGEFAAAEHKGFLRCLYLVSNESEIMREKLVEVYRRDDFFGDPDAGGRIRSAWSRLEGFTCERAIQAELTAICAPQVTSRLMHGIFDNRALLLTMRQMTPEKLTEQ